MDNVWIPRAVIYVLLCFMKIETSLFSFDIDIYTVGFYFTSYEIKKLLLNIFFLFNTIFSVGQWL